jgi:hypothetical protein
MHLFLIEPFFLEQNDLLEKNYSIIDAPPSPSLDSKEPNYVKGGSKKGIGAAPSFQH